MNDEQIICELEKKSQVKTGNEIANFFGEHTRDLGVRQHIKNLVLFKQKMMNIKTILEKRPNRKWEG